MENCNVTPAQPGKIYAAMIAAMGEIGAISKDNTTTGSGNFASFKFRGIDDVYNALHDILAKNKIFTVPEVINRESQERTKSTGAVTFYEKLRMRYTFFTEDGSSVSAVVEGIAMDSGDKAGNKAMAIAHKYCLLQMFCIPTKEEKDPDAEVHENIQPQGAPKAPTPGAKPAGTPPPAKSQPTRATAPHGTAEAFISDAQAKRLYAISMKAGKTAEEMKAILAMFDVGNSKEIPKSKYEAICKETEKPARQAGDE